MESTTHPLGTPAGELPPKETTPSLESPANSSIADELSTEQLQLSITLERLRLETSEKERLLELVRLEQLRVSKNEAAEERKFRAEQAERDRELELLRVSEAAEERKFRAEQAERDRELEKIKIESQSDRHGLVSWREKLGKFAGSTSMHGASKIILSKSIIKRLVWLSLFIGSWAMFFVQTELVFRNYLTYPKITQMEIVSDDLQFPDLTFCLYRGVNFYDAQEWLVRKKKRLENNETAESTLADLKLIYSAVHDSAYFDPIFHSVEFQTMVNRSAMWKEEFFISLNAHGPNDRFGRVVDMNIEEVPGGKYLKCLKLSLANHRVESLHGDLMVGSGMIPDMTNESEYPWKGSSSNEGAVVFIHQPGVSIDPINDYKYYELQSNHYHRFFINVKQHVRLGHPYGQCSSIDPFAPVGRMLSDVTYRQRKCLNACKAKRFLEMNDKASIWHPPFEGLVCWVDENDTRATNGSHVKRWCNYTALEADNKHPERRITVEASLLDGDGFNYTNSTNCPCLLPCSETEYDVSVTSNSNPFKFMPDGWFTTLFKQKINLFGYKTNYSGRFRSRIDEPKLSETEATQLIGDDDKFQFVEQYLKRSGLRALKDVARFHIRIDNKIHKTTECPLISPTQLISEIGGQLGVWIGVSVITLVEVIELLIDLCGGCLRRGRKKELEASEGQGGEAV